MSSVLRYQRPPEAPPSPIIGVSRNIEQVRNRIARFARGPLPVLLVGPTGSGKELVARHLHFLSGRRGELIDVNCGALPREMVESLLFGHRKGAFTGAIDSTSGFVTRAHLGTLFLDELSSLPPEGQAKLLRVVETGEVLPLGAVEKSRVDFRLIAAVHEDIDSRVQSGLFRSDLFHRVAGVRIELLPLAARREDIVPLAEHFAQSHDCRLSPEAAGVLLASPWPGNARQLRTTIGRAAALANGTLLDAHVIRGALEDGWGSAFLTVIPDRVSDASLRAELLDACAAHDGQSAPIAAALGISRATLFRRLKFFGISLMALRVSRSLTSL